MMVFCLMIFVSISPWRRNFHAPRSLSCDVDFTMIVKEYMNYNFRRYRSICK